MKVNSGVEEREKEGREMVCFSPERGPALLASQQQGRREEDGEHMAKRMAKVIEGRVVCLWARTPAR